MRHVALIVLFIFFPAFAHANNPITFKTYTISHSTIYPSATAESGLATTTAIDISFLTGVKLKTSIKIVDANGSLIKLLYPHTGTISDPVNNPDPQVWNGTNTAEAQIGNGTYTILISATDVSLAMTDSSKTITIASPGDSIPPDTTDTTDTSTTEPSTQEQTTSSSSGGSSTTKTTYIPPPSALTVDAGGNQDATMEVPLYFSARATTKSGTADSSAKIVWGFGDGSGAEGTAVEKTYGYAGTYLVVVTATDGVATGRDEFTVIVRPGQVHILGIAGTGVMIANDASERLDLSGWALFAGTHSFRIPNGTILLPKMSVLFSSTITKLVIEQEVTLAYPDGDIASRYVSSPEPVEQLSSAPVSSNQVQTVEDIISPKTPVESYENKAVIAPVVTLDTGVAAGAAVPAPALAAVATAPEAPKTPAGGLFHSVWTLGLLGIMALAGGAFILL